MRLPRSEEAHQVNRRITPKNVINAWSENVFFKVRLFLVVTQNMSQKTHFQERVFS